MLPAVFKRPGSPCEVFEALWTIALVYYTLRTALIFTALTLATGLLARLAVVSTLRALELDGQTGMLVLALHAELMELLAGPAIAALGVPRSTSLRLSISAVILGLFVVVEAVFGMGLYGAGQGAWGPVGGWMAGAVQLFILISAAQPVVVMDEDLEEVGENEKKLPDGL